jgi:hypothetical protein
MTRGMPRAARRLMSALAAGWLLAAGAVAVLPAGPASASDDLTAWFSQDPDTALQPCTTPGTFWYPGAAQEVYNPCGGRVWVHYISGSAVATFCVNPGGLAYDLPITWQPGDSTNIQLTSNTARCDAGNGFELYTLVGVGTTPLPSPYNCTNYGAIPETNSWIYLVQPYDCNTRIWLHQNPDGTGNSLCIGPPGLHDSVGPFTEDEYQQALTTNVQAPCSAGGPPYSI